MLTQLFFSFSYQSLRFLYLQWFFSGFYLLIDLYYSFIIIIKKHQYGIIHGDRMLLQIHYKRLTFNLIKMSIEQALKQKQQGNKFFKQKQYEKAIEKYTEAINLDPKNSIFFSNRARSYAKIQKYQESYRDAEKAVELDDKNIKGYYLMGQCLAALAAHTKNPEKLENAIQKLKKSLTLCPSQGKSQYQQVFVQQIYRAKKKLWEIKSQTDRQKKKVMRSYLVNLVETDNNLGQAEKDQFRERIQKIINQNLQAQKVQIPQPLICPITHQLMKDPVCNQYGNSYSRKQYEAKLKENGNHDPITNQKIHTTILYPNINLKKAIESFLEKHPWAYEYKKEMQA